MALEKFEHGGKEVDVAEELHWYPGVASGEAVPLILDSTDYEPETCCPLVTLVTGHYMVFHFQLTRIGENALVEILDYTARPSGWVIGVSGLTPKGDIRLNERLVPPYEYPGKIALCQWMKVKMWYLNNHWICEVNGTRFSREIVMSHLSWHDVSPRLRVRNAAAVIKGNSL